MRSSLECQACFIRQALDVSRLVSNDDDVHARVLRRVHRILSRIDLGMTPPLIASMVYAAVEKVTGCADPYLQAKERSDGTALECWGWAKETVAKSPSPLGTALRLAVAANIVDFGIGVKFDLMDSLRSVLEKGFQVDESAALEAALASSRRLLYVGDNAGEIVFDKLLLETIGALHPALERTFAVRGGPIINDVTLRDAERVRMDEVARVVSTGHAAPGVILEECADDFRAAFRRADIVIAKGQGNYESLSGVGGKRIFFLLRAKCPVIARELGVAVGSFLVTSAPPPAAASA
ncbi:MAG: ARMT1-like domain-containing protein [bacterium]|nr:ARMT1-like domain-containing protein [bacterium]